MTQRDAKLAVYGDLKKMRYEEIALQADAIERRKKFTRDSKGMKFDEVLILTQLINACQDRIYFLTETHTDLQED
ncbi:MAG: hypothetical protein OXH31_06490 [Gammaproteobacteria bacterium]|nr:hypothetical protein [Gammaproteobacteria bacterium]